ncbi:hypothetical protein D3C72_1466970 [compost metagenome]
MGSGLNQHGARHRAHATHLLVGVGHRAGAAGALKTERQILIDIGIHRSGNHPHLRPVGIQLFSDQRCHAGINALAHFGVFTEDGDNAIFVDLHESIGFISGVFWRRGRRCTRQCAG